MRETTKEQLVEPLKLKRKRDDDKIKALKEINEKIFKLAERLMTNEIEGSTYQTWFQKFKEEKAVLEYQLNGMKKTIDDSDDIVERVLPNLGNLYEIYEKGNITQKHTLIRGVFKDSLLWGEGSFRTAFIDPTFYDNVL